VKNLCMFLVKHKMAITFTLIIKTCQILYQFGINWIFFTMPVVVVCSRVCSAKFEFVFSKTSNSHNFRSSYQNKANFISIWGTIEFSLQRLLWWCVVMFVVQNLCMFLVQLQTTISFTLVMKTWQILYRFGVELNFLSNVYYTRV